VVPPAASSFDVIIHPGDTLSVLARKFGVTVAAIVAANPGLDPNRLRVGQSITIPGGTPANAPSPIPPIPESPPPPSAYQPAAEATNQLGLELLRQVAAASPGGNVPLSPYSIQSALAMTYAGADGDTRAEMARVLRFPPDDALLAASFGKLRAELDAMATRYAGSVEWHVANRLFGQAGFEFRASFLALVKDNYGATLQQMDFKTAAGPARAEINTWVADQTHQKITDLIPAGGLTRATTLVLVNALYFKAPWEDAFEKDATENLRFKARGAETIRVPTMEQTAHFGYAKHPGFTAVTLPYRGGDLQFLLLLPDDPAGVDALASSVTPTLLRECARLDAPFQGVVLYLPKFRLQALTIALAQMMQSLGLKAAFDRPPGSANFDRMAPRKPDEYPAIGEVFHKASMDLDEGGTEAAAATAVEVLTVQTDAAPMPRPPPIVVHVDHPFLFAIQHRESGACIFLCKVTDPR
jgi:serpin B